MIRCKRCNAGIGQGDSLVASRPAKRFEPLGRALNTYSGAFVILFTTIIAAVLLIWLVFFNPADASRRCSIL